MKQTPFVIIFQGRSGSTMLASLLASHPDILCRKEEFSMDNAAEFDARGHRNRILSPFFTEPEITNPTPEQCVERLKKIFAKRFKAMGFKFKFPNQVDSFPEVMAALRQRADDIRVIRLFRINQMKRGVSRQHLVRLLLSPSNTELRGGNTQAEKQSGKIVVDLAMLKSFFKRQQRQQERLEKILVDFPHRHEIAYEELLADQDDVMRGLLEFLGVDPEIGLTTNLRKLTPDRLKDIVENYTELVAAFEGTEYEEFLDE